MSEKKPKKQVREYKDWQPKPYKPEYCVDLLDVMARGRGIETFNSDKNISRQMFYNWLKEYSDLRLAYELGKEKAKKYMASMLHDYAIEHPGTKDEAGSPRLNMKAWSAICKYSHQLPDERMLNLPSLTEGDTKSKMAGVLNAVASGEITALEGQQLAQTLEVAQRITETSELFAKVEQLEQALQSGSSDEEFKEEKDVAQN